MPNRSIFWTLVISLILVPRSFVFTASKDVQSDSDKKIDFPYQLPNSRTDLDRELVGKLNEMTTKKEQIKYLLDLLPDKDAKKKVLTDKELHAIRLLGLTKSKDAIQLLIDRLEFGHEKDGVPAMHALARLGEIAVEPLVTQLEKATGSQRIQFLIGALRELKGDKYPKFEKELLERKDIHLSSETRRLILSISESQRGKR